MSFNVVLSSRSEREAQIRKSLSAPIGIEDFYDFRNSLYRLKVIHVDINLPVYRMENFRTFTSQREFIANNKKEQDYFSKGQELESVQQQQHEILAALSKKGVSDSFPVIEVLAKEKQREPLLMTTTGVIVNGNRRLAAMRELYKQDPVKFNDFSHVKCMVLPEDATAEDIVKIEARLQAKPETKLAYDWIGDAELVNSLYNIYGNTFQVAEELNRSEKEIKNCLQALSEADLYIKDWARTEGDYSAVKDDAEQLFKDLPRRLDGKSEKLKDASRVIAWSLLENRDKLDRRVYDFNSAFGKLADDVMDKVAETLGLSTSKTSDSYESATDIIVGVDFDDDNEVQSYDSIIDALRNESTKEMAVEALIAACVSVIESEKGQKSGEAALKLVVQAHSKLQSVDLSNSNPQTHPSIRKQLESICTIVERLNEKLKLYLDRRVE